MRTAECSDCEETEDNCHSITNGIRTHSQKYKPLARETAENEDTLVRTGNIKSLTDSEEEPLAYAVHIDSPLIGTFITLQHTQTDAVETYEIRCITAPTKDEDVEDEEQLPELIRASTNSWLFLPSSVECAWSETWTKFSIACIIEKNEKKRLV